MNTKEKQTAVEWLINVLDIDANDSATKEVINQAKAMEKEQLEKERLNGYEFGTSEAIKEINKNYKKNIWK
jgi:hypothetical protein